MFYLIPADCPAYDTLDALGNALGSDADKFLVVKGDARRIVQRVELAPVASAAPAPKRDRERDAATERRVLDYLLPDAGAPAGEVRTVAEVAKALALSTAEVSRAKAALHKAGYLRDVGKGKLCAKGAA